jgi:hypothetical protein
VKPPDWLPAYYSPPRAVVPTESQEIVTFFATVRRRYPDTIGKIAVHVRNEGQRTRQQTAWQKAEGLTKGAADMVIPGDPAFVCEMKRRDPSKSRWQDGQLDYLAAAQKQGAFVCVAFGCDGALQALEDWLNGCS